MKRAYAAARFVHSQDAGAQFNQTYAHTPFSRPREGRKIAGVCAGFAEYFDTDITLMRVIWVALLLLPPQLGLIAYIVCWVVLPKG